MAGMDFGALKERVRRRAGLAVSDRDGRQGLLGDLVNDGLQLVTTDNPDGWDWLRVDSTFPTVASTEEYAFSTIAAAGVDLWKITGLEMPLGTASRQPLERMSRRQLDAHYPSLTPGVPEAFAVSGQQVVLRPIPDGVYTLTFHALRHEPILDDDGDVPLMPYPWRPAIVAAAAWIKYQELQDWAKAAGAKNVLDAYERNMRIASEPTTGPSRIIHTGL